MGSLTRLASGDHAGALAAYPTLLTDKVRVLGADHPDTLTTRHQIAGERPVGDHAGAQAVYRALLPDPSGCWALITPTP